MIVGMFAHLSLAEQDLVARRVVESRKVIAAAKEIDRLRDAAIRRREREIAEQREAAFRSRQLDMEFSPPIPACRPQGAPGAPKPPMGHPLLYPASRPWGTLLPRKPPERTR